MYLCPRFEMKSSGMRKKCMENHKENGLDKLRSNPGYGCLHFTSTPTQPWVNSKNRLILVFIKQLRSVDQENPWHIVHHSSIICLAEKYGWSYTSFHHYKQITCAKTLLNLFSSFYLSHNSCYICI